MPMPTTVRLLEIEEHGGVVLIIDVSKWAVVRLTQIDYSELESYNFVTKIIVLLISNMKVQFKRLYFSASS